MADTPQQFRRTRPHHPDDCAVLILRNETVKFGTVLDQPKPISALTDASTDDHERAVIGAGDGDVGLDTAILI